MRPRRKLAEVARKGKCRFKVLLYVPQLHFGAGNQCSCIRQFSRNPPLLFVEQVDRHDSGECFRVEHRLHLGEDFFGDLVCS
jgi:hypothetical protein